MGNLQVGVGVCGVVSARGIVNTNLSTKFDMVQGIQGEDTKADISALAFKDNALIADWAKESVACCVNKKIIQGDNEGNFNPKKNATRAEFASIITNVMEN